MSKNMQFWKLQVWRKIESANTSRNRKNLQLWTIEVFVLVTILKSPKNSMSIVWTFSRWNLCSQKLYCRLRQIELKLRWSCWPPPWGGLGGQLFLNIFWSMYRTFIILFPAQRKTLKTPSTYLEHDHKANRKIFRAFWKKSFASKWGFHQNILA